MKRLRKKKSKLVQDAMSMCCLSAYPAADPTGLPLFSSPVKNKPAFSSL